MKWRSAIRVFTKTAPGASYPSTLASGAVRAQSPLPSSGGRSGRRIAGSSPRRSRSARSGRIMIAKPSDPTRRRSMKSPNLRQAHPSSSSSAFARTSEAADCRSDPFPPTGRATAKGACDRTTGAVFRGSESLLTHRWRKQDSNLRSRPAKGSSRGCHRRRGHERWSHLQV